MGDLYLWRCTHCGEVFADLGRMTFDGWEVDEHRGRIYLRSDDEDGDPDFRHTLCGHEAGGAEIERWVQVA